MLEKLKHEVFDANLLLPKYGLVSFTWGNVSGVDRDAGVMVIKPSGVEYEKLTPEDMVVVELKTGNVVEGLLKPSSDTPTHLELYKSFADIGGIVHTHSRFATPFAQAKLSIPPLGTTHADYFYGEIPCTRELTSGEIAGDYEAETGKVIAACFNEHGLSPIDIPAVLVAGHGPFTWGNSAAEAVHNSAVLEIVAEMAMNTFALTGGAPGKLSQELLDKHFFRKHGSGAYYGQANG